MAFRLCPQKAWANEMDDFSEFDLVGIADGIRAGSFSSQEVTQWSLARLDTLGKKFNAVFRIDHERALERARHLDTQRMQGGMTGPLHGVPLAHKDMYQVAGLECHAGSLVLKGHIAKQNAFVIDALDRSGQVNVGSLHMSEFSLSPTGFNLHYGSGKNPWNPEHVSGGSSSGSGIAVAGRMVFGALGGDTGGSIRLPAAMCGVTGLKTTFRRISTMGTIPLSFSLDALGPIARSARDCARLLTSIACTNPMDSSSVQLPPEDFEAHMDGNIGDVRIGVLGGYYQKDIDNEVASCLEASLGVLKQCGAAVVSAATPDLLESINALSQLILSVEAATLQRKWLQTRPDDYSDQVRARIEQGFLYPAVRYAEALSLRNRFLANFMSTGFSNCDILFSPALPVLPPTIAETTIGDAADVHRVIAKLGQFMRGINYLGLPAISVPAGVSKSGLPMAYQLIGKPFSESILLKVADAFQRQSDWHRVSPFGT